MAFKIATVIAVGFRIGNTIPKKVCNGVQPSIIAASSISIGTDLMKPANIKMESPAPKPRYKIHIPKGFFKWKVSARLVMVNITIWNGTIMEKANI